MGEHGVPGVPVGPRLQPLHDYYAASRLGSSGHTVSCFQPAHRGLQQISAFVFIQFKDLYLYNSKISFDTFKFVHITNVYVECKPYLNLNTKVRHVWVQSFLDNYFSKMKTSAEGGRGAVYRIPVHTSMEILVS